MKKTKPDKNDVKVRLEKIRVLTEKKQLDGVVGGRCRPTQL